MGAKRTRFRTKVRITHLKYAAIQNATLLRYKHAVRAFFAYLKLHRIAISSMFSFLDFQLSEYFNFLYLADRPMHWAADALSGFKRLLPSCKKHLDVSSSYIRYWGKSVPRQRALPLSPELCKGVAAVAIARHKPRLGLAFIISFLGLLRVSEVLNLKAKHILFVHAELVHLVIADSKGATRKGCPEAVQVRDKAVVAALRRVVSNFLPDDLVFNFSYHEFAAGLTLHANFSSFLTLDSPHTALGGVGRPFIFATMATTTGSRSMVDGPKLPLHACMLI